MNVELRRQISNSNLLFLRKIVLVLVFSTLVRGDKNQNNNIGGKKRQFSVLTTKFGLKITFPMQLDMGHDGKPQERILNPFGWASD